MESRPITAWPIIYYKEDKQTNTAEGDFLFPLVKYNRDPEKATTLVRLPPFNLLKVVIGQNGYKEIQICYLANFRKHPPAVSVTIHPFIFDYARNDEDTRGTILLLAHWETTNHLVVVRIFPIFYFGRLITESGFVNSTIIIPPLLYRYVVEGKSTLMVPLFYRSIDNIQKRKVTIFFPIYWYEENPTKFHRIFWPIVGWGHTSEFKWFSLVSSIFKLKLYTQGGFQLDLPYPFFRILRLPEYLFIRIFPGYFIEKDLFGISGRILIFFWAFSFFPDGKHLRRIGVFPFFKFDHKGDTYGGDVTFLSLIFYLKTHHRSGRFSVTMVSPMLYVQYMDETETGPEYRAIFPMGFVSKSGGQKTSMVFPIYFLKSTQDLLIFISSIYTRVRSRDLNLDVVLGILGKFKSPNSSAQFLLPLIFNLKNTNFKLKMISPLIWHYRDLARRVDVIFPLGFSVVPKNPRNRKIQLVLSYFDFQHENQGTHVTVLFPIYFNILWKENYNSKKFSFVGTFLSGMMETETKRWMWFLFPIFYREAEFSTRNQVENSKTLILFPLFQNYVSQNSQTTFLFPLFFRKNLRGTSLGIFPIFFSFRGTENQERFLGILGIFSTWKRQTRDEKFSVGNFLLFYWIRNWTFKMNFQLENPQLETNTFTETLGIFPAFKYYNDHVTGYFHEIRTIYHFKLNSTLNLKELSIIWMFHPAVTMFRFREIPGKFRAHFLFPIYYHQHKSENNETSTSFLWIFHPKLAVLRRVTWFQDEIKLNENFILNVLSWKRFSANHWKLSFLFPMLPTLGIFQVEKRGSSLTHFLLGIYRYHRNSAEISCKFLYIFNLAFYSYFSDAESTNQRILGKFAGISRKTRRDLWEMWVLPIFRITKSQDEFNLKMGTLGPLSLAGYLQKPNFCRIFVAGLLYAKFSTEISRIEALGIPNFSLISWERSGNQNSHQFRPLYSYRVDHQLQLRELKILEIYKSVVGNRFKMKGIFPIFRYRQDDNADTSQLSIFWIISQRFTLFNYHRIGNHHRSSLWPTHIIDISPNSTEIRILWIMRHLALLSISRSRDSLQVTLASILKYVRHNDAFKLNLAGILSYVQENGTIERRILWRFLRNFQSDEKHVTEINPFYYREWTPQVEFSQILGGIVSWEKKKDVPTQYFVFGRLVK